MKKIIILIICIICLGGCYDYSELEDLAYIYGMGIDYKNGEYVLSYEVLNNKKSNNAVKEEAYLVSGHGDNFVSAFNDANRNNFKMPLFSHIKLLIISTSVAKDKMDEINDFINRNPKIRDNYYMVVADNPEDILSTENEDNKIVTKLIMSKLRNNIYLDTMPLTYNEFMSRTENLDQDNALPLVRKENNNIIIDKYVSFNKYKMVSNLDVNDYLIYNFFMRNDFRWFLRSNDPTMEMKFALKNKKIIFDKDKIEINVVADGYFMDNPNNFNLKNEKTYLMLQNTMQKTMEEKLNLFIKKCQENNADLLGIRKSYYDKNRSNIGKYWTKENIGVNAKIEISKKGDIYEFK